MKCPNRAKPVIGPKPCAECGIDYVPTSNRQTRCLICHAFKCVVCGKSFVLDKVNKGRRYCSKRCSHIDRKGKPFRSRVPERPPIKREVIDGVPCVWIPISNEKWTVIEEGDYGLVGQHFWCYRDTGYAYRNRLVTEPPGPSIRMHRVLCQCPDEMEVDHINGNGLDNRRSNLRTATHAQNSKNQCVRTTNTSGAKGVCWHKAAGKWFAQITVDGKNLYLGLYEDFNDAVSARSEAERQYFGEFVRQDAPSPFYSEVS